MPFIYGLGLYYLPVTRAAAILDAPKGFVYETVEQAEISALYQHEGFRNALQYDVNHPRPDVLAVLAKKDGRVAGMAGASADCARLWQIGIDVLPEYRGRGLASCLVNILARETMRRGYIPYYGTSSSNIASQRTAFRAGFYPAWVCAYRGKFDALTTKPVG